MAHSFRIDPAALKRSFSAYVVVAQGNGTAQLYIGKTGDNREGCNPMISRCGNHFSYNKSHSQIRNKISAHETWEYTYVFDHFCDYADDIAGRRTRIDQINEIERWLNLEIQKAFRDSPSVAVVNPYGTGSRLSKEERQKRAAFRTTEVAGKVAGIVEQVKQVLGLVDRHVGKRVEN